MPNGQRRRGASRDQSVAASIVKRMKMVAVRGFTLLEMLVVLALMALATGMALPRMSGWLDDAQERGWRADVKAYLEGMPVRAFLAGEEIRLDAAAIQLAVPGGPASMELQLPEPLAYGSTGAAAGGRLLLLRGGVREVWTIEPVSGHVIEGS